MTVTLALAGDTMLGRGVAEKLAQDPRAPLLSDELVELGRSADFFVLNLECCISARGARWPAPGKPFFFRAPPVAADRLAEWGVDAVTLANNHALDFGHDALLDTFEHLTAAGVRYAGAGPDMERARAPLGLESRGFRLDVLGATDHPADFAAERDRPGVAHARWRDGGGDWLIERIRASFSDAVLVTPHWGPNMVAEPLPFVRQAGAALIEAGATLVAGHSAHVFQGVEGRIIYDLGDFIDDYAIDPVLRNDLGLFFLVALDRRGPVRVEAVPLKLGYCYTSVAEDEDAAWIRARFESACAAFGSAVTVQEGRSVVDIR